MIFKQVCINMATPYCRDILRRGKSVQIADTGKVKSTSFTPGPEVYSNQDTSFYSTGPQLP